MEQWNDHAVTAIANLNQQPPCNKDCKAIPSYSSGPQQPLLPCPKRSLRLQQRQLLLLLGRPQQRPVARGACGNGSCPGSCAAKKENCTPANAGEGAPAAAAAAGGSCPCRCGGGLDSPPLELFHALAPLQCWICSIVRQLQPGRWFAHQK